MNTGASGLTRGEFCRRHHVPVTTLDYWRRSQSGKPRLVEVNVAANEIPPGFTLILVNGRRNREFLAFRRGRAFASDPVGRNGVIFGLGPGDQDLHRARRCRYAQICAVHGYVESP
jgi:hypothetical protein